MRSTANRNAIKPTSMHMHTQVLVSVRMRAEQRGGAVGSWIGSQHYNTVDHAATHLVGSAASQPNS